MAPVLKNRRELMKKITLKTIGVACLTGLIIVVVCAIQALSAVVKFMNDVRFIGDTEYGTW